MRVPLWKLQTVGREHLDFLYANMGAGNTITLRPGVAFCFRKFHPLISDLVRGALLVLAFFRAEARTPA